MKVLAEKLKENNLKVTPQRLAIYSFLKNTNKHPSAETIYNELRENYPTMSLATVYKTVASLKEAKLIQELNVGEDSFRYDAETKFHSHIICVECNEVFDFNSPNLLNNIKEEITEQMDFALLYEQVYFYGVCKDCKNKKH